MMAPTVPNANISFLTVFKFLNTLMCFSYLLLICHFRVYQRARLIVACRFRS